ncbi:UNVERIFIED_CONTAM: hypothetical protein FKN15_015978 [Acipenser sinensis]
MFKTPMEVAVYQLHNFSISFFSSFVGGDVVSVKLDNSASGASVVAIDNKIEQAMDLVKNHLMYAVREEVEILKEQIKELAEKNSQLERENSLLKNLASPEQMEKFQLHLPSDVPALMENQQGVAETEASPHTVGSAVSCSCCAYAAQLPLPAQSTQPQHLPQSLTPPIPSSSSAPQVTFNQLQTLLQPIIDSQLALSARLDKLENPALAPPAFSSSTPAYTLGTSFSVPPVPPPEFNLSSATVASSSSPRAITSHSISPKIRKLIIEGKDVNLVSILIASSEFLDHRVVDCGDVSVTLKSRDPRLQKSLSVGEFVLAFSIYRDILCSVYPHRLQELNQYLFLVVELAVRYGGALFYQYHRAFSAKAAATLSADNRIIDWSRSDTDLFTRIFSGIRPNACSACASTAHSSYLCPKTAASSLQPIHHPLPSLLSPRHLAPASIHASAPPTRSQARDVYGRPIKFTGGRQICNNFNTSACFSKTCKYLHACSFCNDAHSRSICPLSAK